MVSLSLPLSMKEKHLLSLPSTASPRSRLSAASEIPAWLLLLFLRLLRQRWEAGPKTCAKGEKRKRIGFSFSLSMLSSRSILMVESIGKKERRFFCFVLCSVLGIGISAAPESEKRHPRALDAKGRGRSREAE